MGSLFLQASGQSSHSPKPNQEPGREWARVVGQDPIGPVEAGGAGINPEWTMPALSPSLFCSSSFRPTKEEFWKEAGPGVKAEELPSTQHSGSSS